MSTRKEQLFNAKKKPSGSSVIPATVRFKHNKKKGSIDPLSPQEKMLCALRKVLGDMSSGGGRWFIMGNKVKLTQVPTTTEGKPGGPQSYRAAGRCKVGVAQGKSLVTKYIEFSISYRDVVDDRGLADVVYFDPTTVDELARTTPVDLSDLG